MDVARHVPMRLNSALCTAAPCSRLVSNSTCSADESPVTLRKQAREGDGVRTTGC